MLTGDPETVARVEGRQMLGSGWVSHILQRLVLELRKDPEVQALLERAAETYDARRTAFVDALRADGIEAFGRSGFNVWIPVAEEEPVLRGLLQRGWAVRGGEAYRVATPPGIRVTTATLEPDEAVALAADVEAILRPRSMTRSA
jgi:DNA-binding transcriptional MocR family regulator